MSRRNILNKKRTRRKNLTRRKKEALETKRGGKKEIMPTFFWFASCIQLASCLVVVAVVDEALVLASPQH